MLKRTPHNITVDKKHTEMFEGLKSDLMQACCNEPLHIVRFDRTFLVHVDASAYAAAGMITQEDETDGIFYCFFQCQAD